MKKISAIIVALLIVAISAVTAFAAGINDNEQKVLDELKTSVEMQGVEMNWPAAYVNQAENYFNTIDMTSDQAEQIIAVIRSGKTQLESTGAKNIAECTAEQKKELMSSLTKVMEPVNGTASFDNVSGEVALKSESGEVIFKAVPTLVAKDGGKIVLRKRDPYLRREERSLALAHILRHEQVAAVDDIVPIFPARRTLVAVPEETMRFLPVGKGDFGKELKA